MKISFFRSVRFDGDWEIGFVAKRWQLRVGRSQCAFWLCNGYDFRPLFNWVAPAAK